MELSVIRTLSSNNVACVVIRSRDSTYSIHGSDSVKSAGSYTFRLCERSWALVITILTLEQDQRLFDRLPLSLVSLVSHVSLVFRGRRILELLRFICGQRLLGCQIALVLNGKLVDTVGDMLVDLTQSEFHVVERFFARDIVDYGDVACTLVSVEHVRWDLELTTVVQHCRNLVDFVGGEFVSTLVEVDISDCHRARHGRAQTHTAADEFWWALLLCRFPACRS